MKERKIIASIRLNTITFLLTVFAILNLFLEFIKPQVTPGNEVYTLNIELLSSFGYISAILVGIASLLMIIFEFIAIRKNKNVPKIIELIKYVATCAAALTFFVSYTIFLPVKYDQVGGIFYVLDPSGTLYTHTLIPLFSIVTCIFLEPFNKLKKFDFFIPVGIILIYPVVDVLLQLINDKEAHYFIVDFSTADQYHSIFNSSIYISSIIAIGTLVYFLFLLLKNYQLKGVIYPKKQQASINTTSLNINDIKEAKKKDEKEEIKAQPTMSSNIFDDLITSKVEEANKDVKEVDNQKQVEETIEIKEKVENIEPEKEVTPVKEEVEELKEEIEELKEEIEELKEKPLIKEEKIENVEKEDNTTKLKPVQKEKPVKPTQLKKVNKEDNKENAKVSKEKVEDVIIEERRVNPPKEKEETKPKAKSAPKDEKEVKVKEEIKGEEKEVLKEEKEVEKPKPNIDNNVFNPFANVFSDEENKKENEAKVYHVSKQKSSGKWQVKLANGAKAIRLFNTQKEANEYAKDLARRNDGSVRLHSLQGKIRKNS